MTWTTFYLICFLVGFLFAVLSLAGATSRFHLPGRWHLPGAHHGGGVHLPAGHGATHPGLSARGPAVHAGAGGARPTSMSPFNFFTFVAFLAWFGGTGYILTRYAHVWDLLALGIATLAGAVGAAIVFWFLVKVLLAHERVLDPADYELIGVLGKISSTIRQGGTGEMIFSQAGTRRACGARSEDGSAIPKQAEVVITRYERGIAYVRRWEELSEETAGCQKTEPAT